MPSVDYTAIRQACQPVPRVVDPCPMVRFGSEPNDVDVDCESHGTQPEFRFNVPDGTGDFQQHTLNFSVVQYF